MSDEKKINLTPKRFFGRPFCLLCLAAAQRIAHTSHSLSNRSSRVARLAGAPSLHVNRP